MATISQNIKRIRAKQGLTQDDLAKKANIKYSTLTKQDIINAIKKTAKENGGKPLGMSRFEKETGIKTYEWKKYWARIGDAQKEAGFMPNELQGAYAEEFLFEKVITVYA